MTKRNHKRTTSETIQQKEEITQQFALQTFFKNKSPPPPRKFLTVSSVSEDKQGLINLAKDGSWKSAVELSKKLSLKHLKDPEMFLKYKLVELQALGKLRRMNQITEELKKIGLLDSAKYQFESYPKTYPNRKGSMVPFSLRVFLAELQHLNGNTEDAIDQLYTLHSKCIREIAKCQKIKKRFQNKTKENQTINNEKNLESLNSKNDQTNKSVGQNENKDQAKSISNNEGGKEAIENVEEERQEKTETNELDVEDEDEERPPRVTAFFYHLQHSIMDNDIECAFQDLELEVFNFSTIEEIDQKIVILHKRQQWILFALTNYHIVQQNFELATRHLWEIYKKYTDDPVLISIIGRVHLKIGDVEAAKMMFKKVETLTSRTSLYSVMNRGFYEIAMGEYQEGYNNFHEICEKDPNDPIALNNLAIMNVYNCNVEKTIQLLEDFIKKNPKKNISEPIIYNLCTLYNLAEQNPQEKKILLKYIVKTYASECFDYSQFN
ncbi:trafficking protein particle complex subunit 12 [Anaeramoeba flamelloides]|uniref:Trafficking protein particle complex subunit 12 n=1 Tax=Anaeramoeba flamelloides TaxID=1746091 RepID=A0ABQ8YI30_9EUKA|nr:trafficking protein particle complex subunit 12 [Anaeramoeba flamelloides]